MLGRDPGEARTGGVRQVWDTGFDKWKLLVKYFSPRPSLGLCLFWKPASLLSPPHWSFDWLGSEMYRVTFAACHPQRDSASCPFVALPLWVADFPSQIHDVTQWDFSWLVNLHVWKVVQNNVSPLVKDLMKHFYWKEKCWGWCARHGLQPSSHPWRVRVEAAAQHCRAQDHTGPEPPLHFLSQAGFSLMGSFQLWCAFLVIFYHPGYFNICSLYFLNFSKF